MIRKVRTCGIATVLVLAGCTMLQNEHGSDQVLTPPTGGILGNVQKVHWEGVLESPVQGMHGFRVNVSSLEFTESSEITFLTMPADEAFGSGVGLHRITLSRWRYLEKVERVTNALLGQMIKCSIVWSSPVDRADSKPKPADLFVGPIALPWHEGFAQGFALIYARERDNGPFIGWVSEMTPAEPADTWWDMLNGDDQQAFVALYAVFFQHSLHSRIGFDEVVRDTNWGYGGRGFGPSDSMNYADTPRGMLQDRIAESGLLAKIESRTRPDMLLGQLVRQILAEQRASVGRGDRP